MSVGDMSDVSVDMPQSACGGQRASSGVGSLLPLHEGLETEAQVVRLLVQQMLLLDKPFDSPPQNFYSKFKE